jgi:hypothetical protein
MTVHRQHRVDSRSRVETDAYADMMRRMMRAYLRRVADGDPEDLAGLITFIDESERALAHTVRDMRKAYGWSWTQIGAALGISRQAAQQRFARIH